MKEETFEVRDQREKEWYFTDNKFLNGYAKYVGIYAVGIYSSLCRHANKSQKSWPSINKICDELDIGKNSTIEGIKRLEFFGIIKKIRVGKQCTNRYLLTKKSNWKEISEVCLKDFSEVCHINFKGLSHKLQGFATQTSIVRKHNSKKIKSKKTNSANAEQSSPNGSVVKQDKKKQINSKKLTLTNNMKKNLLSLLDSPSKISRKKNKKIELSIEDNKNVAEIINRFKVVNPFIKFQNVTIRKSAIELLNKFGFKQSLLLIDMAISVHGKQYAPVINNPYQLVTKLGSLKAYFDRTKNEKKFVGNEDDFNKDFANV